MSTDPTAATAATAAAAASSGATLAFTKMHGLGNDYIYMWCPTGAPERPAALAREMSCRHTGVGADGLILILPSEIADFRMQMFNADGSEGRMCGNASRCIAKYVYDNGLTSKRIITLETLAGVKTLTMEVAQGKVREVTVDMGEPEIEAAKVPVATEMRQFICEPVTTSAAGTLRITAVSMGNPHGVIFVNDLAEAPVLTAGPELEKHPLWPDRANIEFAQVLAPDHIRMRVWERGSGETMACGTGACATLVAAVINGLTAREARVELPGGTLAIEWGDDGHIYMRGPATTVFTGLYTRQS